MRANSLTRFAAMGALLAGLACGKNMDTMAKPDETAVNPDSTQNPPAYKEGARDTTLNGPGDSARTRPDEGQPVTSKGDTLNTGVDSTNVPPTGNVGVDTSGQSSMDTTGTSSMDTTGTSSMDTTGTSMDTTAHMGNDSTSGMSSDSTR